MPEGARQTLRTIGEIAAILHTSTDSIRFYERKGLIKPTAKNRLGYRLYDEKALRVLNYIKQAQRCGFSLEEIGDMLNARTEGRARCYSMYQLGVRKRKELQDRVRALSDMLATLNALIQFCPADSAPLERCPMLHALEEPPSEQRKAMHPAQAP